MPESRYRFSSRIAVGGMAEVFKGVAESMQGFRKRVAIKRVLPSLAENDKFVKMFLDEARLSLHLQHANVVPVFDIGKADKTYFIVMEYVEGIDLKALLKWRRRIRRPLTVGQVIYIANEICKGLAYAHDLVHPETGQPLGLVHRDISPPNILLSTNGEIKVTDFGLAKAADQLEKTDPGVVKGKMSYLSPEAARGDEADRRADIFAVGILMYEMLTGKRLFKGETDYQTVEQVRAAVIPSISEQNSEVEQEVEDIIRKCLNKRLDDRFQSAADVQEALTYYWFSRGLRFMQRDMADLVKKCVVFQERKAGKPNQGRPAAPSTASAISGSVSPSGNEQAIQGFESVGFEEEATRATLPTDLPFLQEARKSAGAVQKGMDDAMVDPREWMNEPGFLAQTGKHKVKPARVTSRPTMSAAEQKRRGLSSSSIESKSGLALLASDPLLRGTTPPPVRTGDAAALRRPDALQGNARPPVQAVGQEPSAPPVAGNSPGVRKGVLAMVIIMALGLGLAVVTLINR